MTTQILDTRTQDTRAAFIPITKLLIHDANVRRTDKRAEIEALAASIAAHGLLQNLTVVAREGGRYAVVAGGRRLAALKLLAKQGRIARDFAAPCQIVPEAAAGETSLAENVQRVAMNVMDEVEAFERLIADGLTSDDIARRFGASVRHVEQRLALARLSPKIKTAYKRAELTLDVARAFCLSDDHAAQEAVFRSMAKPISHAGKVRAALTQGRLPAHDRLARFVGLEPYEAAGGRISRDLFDETAVFLDDADLLRRLAADKLEALREGLIAQGWGWAEINLGYGGAEGCVGERLTPNRQAPSPETRAAADTLHAQIEALDAALNDAEDEDPRWGERDGLEAQLETIEQSALNWDPTLMNIAGVAISIGPDGAPSFTQGLIKRTDMKAFTKARRQHAAPAEVEANESEECTCTDEASQRLPKRVTLALTEARTQALRAALGASPHIALAALIDVLSRASRRDRHPAFDVSATMKSFDGDETVANPELAFHDLTATPVDVLLDRLAGLFAATLDASHAGITPQDIRLQAEADALAAALDIDMTRTWTPNEVFWQQVPKSVALDAMQHAPSLAQLAEEERAAMLRHLAKMKKAELASAVAQALEGSGWLPELLITPVASGAIALTQAGEAKAQGEQAA